MKGMSFLALTSCRKVGDFSSSSIPGSNCGAFTFHPLSRFSRCPGLSTFVSHSQKLGPEAGEERPDPILSELPV